MYTLTLDLTITYTINSFLFFNRTSLLIESCAYFIFKRVVQFVHSFVESLSVFSKFLRLCYLLVLVIWIARFFSISVLNVCYVLYVNIACVR